MPQQKEVHITIDQIGNSKIEAIGFNGKGCAEATASLEAVLSGNGAEVTREFKPEWNQATPVNQQKVKQGW